MYHNITSQIDLKDHDGPWNELKRKKIKIKKIKKKNLKKPHTMKIIFNNFFIVSLIKF